MNYRQWPYRWRTFWEARDPAWKMLLMVVGGLVAIVALGMCPGCTAVGGYMKVAHAQAMIADDNAAQALEIALCALPDQAKLRNYREEQLHGIALFCSDSYLESYLEGLKRRAAEMKAACEPEVGP